MLTGNTDVDGTIISLLNLDEVRYICQTNTYASKLCKDQLKHKYRKVNKKVEYIINLFNKRDYSI